MRRRVCLSMVTTADSKVSAMVMATCDRRGGGGFFILDLGILEGGGRKASNVAAAKLDVFVAADAAVFVDGGFWK